jgi:hypothetical protein
MTINFDRPVAQAGSTLKGTIQIKIGTSDQKALEQFTAGAVVELTLRGQEKVFWAQGYHHDENATRKKLTHGDKRRENLKNLCT